MRQEIGGGAMGEAGDWGWGNGVDPEGEGDLMKENTIICAPFI